MINIDVQNNETDTYIYEASGGLLDAFQCRTSSTSRVAYNFSFWFGMNEVDVNVEPNF